MNCVFIGSSKFGLRCLSTCLEISGLNIVGVVTAPQTFPISYRPEGVKNVLYADVAGFAGDRGLPCRTLVRSMSESGLLDAVRAWKPDMFLVVGWYHMIPKKWRELAPAYGLHASLLPDYSGGAPLVWAMINGARKTGITLFQMDDSVDSGPVAGQKEEPIHPDDTIATLYGRIEERGLELLGAILPQLAAGTLTLKPQDDSKRRTLPQRAPEDGWIDWNQDANAIVRFIRAQTYPYPGAYTSLKRETMQVWCASVRQMPDMTEPAATVVHVGSDRYVVSCGGGAIELEEISYGEQTYEGRQLFRLLGGGRRSSAGRRTA